MKFEPLIIAIGSMTSLLCVLIVFMQAVNFSELNQIKDELQILEGSVIHD